MIREMGLIRSLNRNDGNHLNLITCDGEWNEDQKTFSKRLVVFSDAVF